MIDLDPAVTGLFAIVISLILGFSLAAAVSFGAWAVIVTLLVFAALVFFVVRLV